ncbi:rab GTPase [Babesia ovata]|uniref:Rab GTPase n=1 Tax=Babesia ovata TaxID=189622 RepID=A0A2H6KFV4_9APIC|nr:rab GTPase [Babesia ovata]GBE61839.1 rab GTPase [Babesia ovata]
MSTSGNVRSINEIWLTAETAAISDRIEFGVPAIDSAFGGGIYCGKVTEIHGAAGSGKTQLALTLVAQELITSNVEGTNGVLIYFHTGGTFPIARLCEMIEGKMEYVDPSARTDPAMVKGILKNLCIDKVTEPGVCYMSVVVTCRLQELVMKLVNMYGAKDDSRNIRLVVIDSIAPLFRSTFHSKGSGKNPRSNLLQVSSFLKRLASEMDLAILVLNEVTGGGDAALKPVGGSTNNELELCVWSADMFKYGIAASYESYGSLKTAIRRGVPDLIKQYIWIKANGADRFYIEHPNFYKHSFTTTFGQNIPEVMGEDCPTFCGGISGLQSDVLGTPVRAKDIDFSAASLDADGLSDSVYQWHRRSQHESDGGSAYDTDEESPLTRELSVASLRDNYYRHKPSRSHRSAAYADDDSAPHVRFDVGAWRDLSALPLPDVSEDAPEVDRRDPLDHYLSVLHAENSNQMMLLKAAKKKIRERQVSLSEVGRSGNMFRQFSDTSLLSSGLTLPNPPSHYPKIVNNQIPLAHKDSVTQICPRTSTIIRFLRQREQRPVLAASDVAGPRRCRILDFCARLGLLCGGRRRIQTVYVDWNTSNSDTVPEGEPPLPGELSGQDNFSAATTGDGTRTTLEDGHIQPINDNRVTAVTFQADVKEPNSTDSGYIRFPSAAGDTMLVRQATTKVFHSSVYKLSDITDYTALLTPSGVNEVKRILWCLNTSFSSTIEFLPIIPSLCCLLLVYMAPDIALCVLHCLMVKAVESARSECGERFLFVDREGFVDFVKYVLNVMRYHMRKLVAKLQLLNVDVAAWIARSVQSGFSHVLPFDHTLRIYGDFLFEGEIVLCRYCIALIKHGHDTLMKCNTQHEAEEALYNIGLDNTLDVDQLTKLAYSFRLKYYKSEVKGAPVTPYLMPVKIRAFYRPRLSSFSRIVREHKWETIWSWLLPRYRILDPRMVYSSDRHGTSMLGLVKAIKDSDRSGVASLLFIETTTRDILGVFIPTLNCEATDGLFTSPNREYVCALL